MKTAVISAVIAGLFATVGAAPVCNAIPTTVDITFSGGPAGFDQTFPTDDSVNSIRNDLSISDITGHTDGVTCTFYGVDGSVTTVVGAETVPVGPPQTQVSGICGPSAAIQKNAISGPWTTSQSEAREFYLSNSRKPKGYRIRVEFDY